MCGLLVGCFVKQVAGGGMVCMREELGGGRGDVRGLSGFVGSVSVLTAFSHPDVVESSWWSGRGESIERPCLRGDGSGGMGEVRLIP